MRKAIKFCLALAMVGSMASVALADVTVSGNGWFGFEQITAESKADDAAAGDTYSTMDMSSGALLSVAGSTETDGWTASANLAIDSDIALDGYGFSVAKDGMTISLSDDDLGGADQGQTYASWLDEYHGVGDHVDKGDSKVMVTLDMGLTVMVGINSKAGGHDPSELLAAILKDMADPSSDSYDADTEDFGSYSQQDIGVSYAGAAGDISYAVTYEQASTVIDKKAGGLETGPYDGLTASDLGIGVGYAMGDMGFNFGYGQEAIAYGGTGTTLEYAATYTVISADIGLGEDTGVTALYSTKAYENKGSAEIKEYSGSETDMYVSYTMPMLGATLGVAYYTHTVKTNESGAKELTTGNVGARLKYSF